MIDISRCQFCSCRVHIRKYGDDDYPYSKDYGFIYKCEFCDSYVGCHDGTRKPLGNLANRMVRELRKEAHLLFDNIWRSREMTRKQAYKRMAEILDISVKDAHISQISIELLEKLIRCLKLRRK